MSKNYDDIINLPHHVSETRPQMSMEKRAAQFAPFKAMVGYDLEVEEAARLTSERTELDEDAVAILDMKLQMLVDTITDRPEVTITYFQPDGKKAGGTYITVSGTVEKIDGHKNIIVLASGNIIPILDILDIEGELFGQIE